MIHMKNTCFDFQVAQRAVSGRALAVAFGVLVAWGGTIMAQQAPPLPLEVAAKAARSGDPTTVRALTDLVIAHLPMVVHASFKLNDNLFQAEYQYRQGARQAVSPAQLVVAINATADSLSLPTFVRTNARQLQLYQLLLLSAYPSLVGPRPHTASERVDMSVGPSAAVFIALQLLSLKMTQSSYQRDPDEWSNATIAKRLAQSSTPGPQRSVSFNVGSPIAPPSLQYQELLDGVAAHAGPAATSFIAMLATFGIGG